MSRAVLEAPPDHWWVQHDAAPQLIETLVDGNGDPVNLQSATVRYVLRSVWGAAPDIDAAASNLQVGDGSDGTKGMVGFTPSALQTDEYGDYIEVWRVTFSGGAPQTFPAIPHKVRIRKASHTTP